MPFSSPTHDAPCLGLLRVTYVRDRKRLVHRVGLICSVCHEFFVDEGVEDAMTPVRDVMAVG